PHDLHARLRRFIVSVRSRLLATITRSSWQNGQRSPPSRSAIRTSLISRPKDARMLGLWRGIPHHAFLAAVATQIFDYFVYFRFAPRHALFVGFDVVTPTKFCCHRTNRSS